MRFIIALSIAITAMASPLALPALNRGAMHHFYTRQNSTSGGLSCASDQYTADQVKASADAACKYIEAGETAGGSKYPESMDNREGFQWPVDGPYFEFPIMNDGDVYDGGSPGADRIVLNQNCDFAGGVTHTGGSESQFVQCTS